MKYHPLLIFSTLFLIIGITSCIKVPEQYQGIPPGKWRAILRLDDIRRPLNTDAKPMPDEMMKFEEVSSGELPFIFDVVYDSPDKFHLEIINGTETIKVHDIAYGRDRVNGDDTIVIDFPHYDSHIKAIFEEDVIEGRWVVETKDDYYIPFIAKHGMDHRFSTLRKEPVMDISGKWEVTFDVDTENPEKAIGEFQQKGNQLRGTFLTETGDYRFLDGTIQANKIYLSCFDGSHAFLFEAKILEDKSMIGSFRSGKHYTSTWTAVKNPNVKLSDPNELTFLKKGFEKVSFSFPNSNGKFISANDDAYKGKYKIIQIVGTWCPNCADETAFLTEYFKENPNENVEVIGLAFEKHKEEKKAFAAIETFKKRFSVPYEVLWAGSSSKKEAAEKLPMLNHILSYPTMIFLDKDNRVLKIHTGFSGPATSKYKEFKEEFHSFIQNLDKD